MRKYKNNKGLLDKNRFKAWEKEKAYWLKNLSWKKALRLEESLLSSSFIWKWRKNFFADNPLCLKDSLRKRA